jgi:drug/metabolite transporter (DMT)-like permease
VSQYEIVWTRYGIHLAFMLLVFGPRQGVVLIRTPKFGRQFLSSVLMLAMPLAFIAAFHREPANDALGAFWLMPLMALAVAVFVGKERVGVTTWIVTLVGFIGAVLLCYPDRGVLRLSSLLAVGAGFCLALYLTVIRSLRHEPMVTKLFHTALWVFLALSVALPAFWQVPTPRSMIGMAAIGLIGWCGLYSLDAALELASPALLAPALYSQLVWDALLALLLHTGVHGRRFATGLALLSIVLVYTLLQRQPAATLSPAPTPRR